MKFLKYLILPMSIICCCNNISNTTEKQITLMSKYSNNEISWDDFKHIILSFQNNETLNNDQKEFIKQLTKNIPNLEHYNNKKYCNINDLCNPNPSIGDHDEYPFSYKEILNYLSIDIFESIYKSYPDQQGTHNVEEKYSIFLDKIKDCYQQNIINEEQYINLLKYLLFCNTSRIFYVLNNKILNNNNSQSFIDDLFRYLAFNYYSDNNIASSTNISDITDFINTHIEQNAFTSIKNEIKNLYKTYKSITSKIINEIIHTIECNIHDIAQQTISVRKNIVIPIILGIFSNIIYVLNKEMKFGNWDYYLNKLLEECAIDKISNEFGIIKK